MTGCLGGVSVEIKENSATEDNTNYERVVTVDYGSEQSLDYDDELSETIVEGNSSNGQQQPQQEETAPDSNGTVITDENTETQDDKNINTYEFCGVIFKKLENIMIFLSQIK